jgi:hypothetical protein
MKVKIVPEVHEGYWATEDFNVFSVYYKTSLFSSWKLWWSFTTLEEAEKDLPNLKKSILSRIEEEKRRESVVNHHLNQRTVYKEL